MVIRALALLQSTISKSEGGVCPQGYSRDLVKGISIQMGQGAWAGGEGEEVEVRTMCACSKQSNLANFHHS